MEVLDLARRYLYPYKVKGDEIEVTYCPFCNGGQSKDKNTFHLNTVKLTYKCKRGKCGVTGHFTNLLSHFGEKKTECNSYDSKTKKQYKKPSTVIKTPTQKVEEYFELRKISKETMKDFNIGSDDKGNIIFPFYDENNNFTFAKFRPARKLQEGERKAVREADTKPILFGMNLCDVNLPLIITEGEFDALSVYESGVRNVVSVPSGCQDFTWVDTCWEWLKKFKVIIVFGDSDEAGQEMVRRIIKTFNNEHIVKVVKNYDDIKDANELLYKFGKDAVEEVISNAVEIPIDGVVNLATVKNLDIKKIPRTMSGIKELDSTIGGFMESELSIWTGKRGEGKSTLLSQLCIESIEQNKNVCAYSGELSNSQFKYWIDLQCAGGNNIESFLDNIDGKTKYYVKEHKRKLIEDWYNGKFWLYDNEIAYNTEMEISVLDVFKYCAKRYDCKTFLVDNLMILKDNVSKERETDYFRRQSNFTKELLRFANQYGVHVHLVAHPKKKTGELDCDDVGGLGDITNMAHNVFSWKKLSEEEKLKTGCDGILSVLKNRAYGISDLQLLCNYDAKSRRITHRNDSPFKQYAWEKKDPSNWVQDAINASNDLF